jgi:putative transcriptional regulator
MNNQSVQNSVRKSREAKGLSQERLASMVGLARQSIISIEKGRFLPTVENALRIAEALETTVETLFWLSEEAD